MKLSIKYDSGKNLKWIVNLIIYRIKKTVIYYENVEIKKWIGKVNQ